MYRRVGIVLILLFSLAHVVLGHDIRHEVSHFNPCTDRELREVRHVLVSSAPILRSLTDDSVDLFDLFGRRLAERLLDFSLRLAELRHSWLLDLPACRESVALFLAASDYYQRLETGFYFVEYLSDAGTVAIDGLDASQSNFVEALADVMEGSDPEPRPTATAIKAAADADFDGIADAADECPGDYGYADNRGCPYSDDEDRDGIRDALDACPNEFAPNTPRGCRDFDDDGLDTADDCPNEAGPAFNQGCPQPSAADESTKPGWPARVRDMAAPEDRVPSATFEHCFQRLNKGNAGDVSSQLLFDSYCRKKSD